jgi:hypothetical protein
MHRLKTVLWCAIFPGLAVIAVLNFSITAIQARPSTKSRRSKTAGPNWVNMRSIWK